MQLFRVIQLQSGRESPIVRANNPIDARSPLAIGDDVLIKLAEQRLRQGLAPPPDIYRIEYRQRIDWLQFPDWARPVDPQLFEGSCHEG